MPARLILNADDFGLTPGINRAIGELHAAGVLTSATLMANGPAFDDAVAVARAHPTLGVGCHIVLTDGVPLAPLEHIPGLLGPDGKTLRPSLTDFIQALLRGKIKPAEIELESLFQIHKLQAAGIKITHLDTHKHTHLFPVVARQLLPLRKAITSTPFAIPSSRPGASPSIMAAVPAASPFASSAACVRASLPAFSSIMATSTPPTALSPSPPPANWMPSRSHRCSTRFPPPAPTNSAVTPDTTTAISTVSPPACAPNATPSAPRSSPRSLAPSPSPTRLR